MDSHERLISRHGGYRTTKCATLPCSLGKTHDGMGLRQCQATQYFNQVKGRNLFVDGLNHMDQWTHPHGFRMISIGLQTDFHILFMTSIFHLPTILE